MLSELARSGYGHGAPKTLTGWIISLVGGTVLVGITIWRFRRLAKARQQYWNAQADGATASPSPPGAAGWYPDANDLASLRYFDGQSWTSDTKPRE
ncbi:MAG: hypothetical protein QOG37_1986 [Mycobacterium sp.]|nr:hypothetical protein [Mycobacterium sp.]